MLTNQKRRGVIGGTMATDDGLPFRVELPEPQYLLLLKHSINRSRAAVRLAAAVEHERKKKSYYLVSGFVTDGLALRALALVHAPGALPAIERELERARKK
jgi:hypothetical protein